MSERGHRPRSSFLDALTQFGDSAASPRSRDGNKISPHDGTDSSTVATPFTTPRYEQQATLSTRPSVATRRSTLHSNVQSVISGIKQGSAPCQAKEMIQGRMEQVMAQMKDPTHVWKDTPKDGTTNSKTPRVTLVAEKPVLTEDFVSDRMAFTGAVGTVVIANAITIGVEMDYPDNKQAFLVLEHIFTIIFSCEMIFKMHERGIRGYFKSGWNIMDFILVMMSIADCWVLGILLLVKPDLTSGADLRVYSMLRLLRLVRIIRAVRLLSMFQELWKIVRGIMSSVKTVLWSFMLLVFVLYVCGLFTCMMIGKNTSAGYYSSKDDPDSEEFHSDWDAYEHYGTVPRAMFTLFETCLEPLNLRPVMERQPELLPFFMCFVFLTTFGVLNVIIGTIVDNTMAVSKEAEEEDHLRESEEKLMKLDKIREMSSNKVFDTDDDGTLSIEELKAAMGIPLIMESLAEIQVISGMQPEEFFALLDSRGDGEVTSGDMIIQLAREAIHNEHQQIMDLKISINQKHNFVRSALEFQRNALIELETQFLSANKDMRRELKDIKKFLQHIFGKDNGSQPPVPPGGGRGMEGVVAGTEPSVFQPPQSIPTQNSYESLAGYKDLLRTDSSASFSDERMSKRMDKVETELGGVKDGLEALMKGVKHLTAKIDTMSRDPRASSPSGSPRAPVTSGSPSKLSPPTQENPERARTENPERARTSPTPPSAADHMNGDGGQRNFKPRLPGAPTTA